MVRFKYKNALQHAAKCMALVGVGSTGLNLQSAVSVSRLRLTSTSPRPLAANLVRNLRKDTTNGYNYDYENSDSSF